MKNPIIIVSALAALSVPLMAQSANIRHYWNFEADFSDSVDAFSVVFTSENGPTYSVYGGPNPLDRATWPELSTSAITGDGTNLTFSHAPVGAPATFFFEIRED